MVKDFTTWLIDEMNERGWTNSELARRIHMNPSTVSYIISGERRPGWTFCANVAKVFHIEPDAVFRLAGLLPALPPHIAEEKEAIAILRTLAPATRDIVMRMLRGLRPGPPRPVPIPPSIPHHLKEIDTLLSQLPEETRAMLIPRLENRINWEIARYQFQEDYQHRVTQEQEPPADAEK